MPRRTRPHPRAARIGAAVALLAVAAAPAAAQVIRFPARQTPGAWLSVGAGVLQLPDVVDDGSTNSAWEFSSDVQYRATLEVERRPGTSFGVLATYARPDLRYVRPGTAGGSEALRASATVASLAALFRAGGGPGLHQVIEVSLGARRYSGFRLDDATADLPPADGDVDFIGSLGFGFGYTLGQRAAITLVQDADFAFHQRTEAADTGFDGGIHRGYVTRLGLRFGLGGRGR